MSLKETYEEFSQKSSVLKHKLEQIKSEMTLIEENINGVERNPNFLEAAVQPLYESLWQLQIEYKKYQTELNTITLQLNQLNHILEDMIETD